MISRIHESLSNTSDYIEVGGGFFASEKTAGRRGGESYRFLSSGTGKKSWLSSRSPAKRITRETFEFTVGWRFHFREPSGGEFAPVVR